MQSLFFVSAFSGLSGVENFEFYPVNLGTSIFLRCNDNIIVDFSYFHWSGTNGNYLKRYFTLPSTSSILWQ